MSSLFHLHHVLFLHFSQLQVFVLLLSSPLATAFINAMLEMEHEIWRNALWVGINTLEKLLFITMASEVLPMPPRQGTVPPPPSTSSESSPLSRVSEPRFNLTRSTQLPSVLHYPIAMDQDRGFSLQPVASTPDVEEPYALIEGRLGNFVLVIPETRSAQDIWQHNVKYAHPLTISSF
ncbi:unnamed protein product [Protopolystoma xenopodis]|uniref:Uncharacterized protein n=1 Tax=Protopolystoma xenopodis TaxID=117903 RepID=A0A448XI28_9PLAT|nr:unnamed protein product [Protopolystoma xenopodis]